MFLPVSTKTFDAAATTHKSTVIVKIDRIIEETLFVETEHLELHVSVSEVVLLTTAAFFSRYF